ncbi:MAG TPA: hypothetical protein VIN07_12395 [Flavipsychrobacter sp.]
MEKRIFGVILTLLGIGGLIYAAIIFAEGGNYRQLAIYGILGAIFFFSGIGLIRTTRDNA